MWVKWIGKNILSALFVPWTLKFLEISSYAINGNCFHIITTFFSPIRSSPTLHLIMKKFRFTCDQSWMENLKSFHTSNKSWRKNWKLASKIVKGNWIQKPISWSWLFLVLETNSSGKCDWKYKSKTFKKFQKIFSYLLFRQFRFPLHRHHH